MTPEPIENKETSALLAQWYKRTPYLFWLTAMIVGLIFILVQLDASGFLDTVTYLNESIYHIFGKAYLWFVLIVVFCFFAIALSPLGKIRLGGPDAEPEYSFFSWFSMLFCAGMGTGFLFWGATEPLYHFMNPPLLDTTTIESQKAMAFAYTIFHWGLSPWAVYGLTAIAIGFLSYNMGMSNRMSSFLRMQGEMTMFKRTLALFIDLMTLVAIIAGIAASIGMGVLIIEGGLDYLFGVPSSVMLHFIILMTITGFFLFSSYLGLENGIRMLSNISMWLSIVLLLSVMWYGPHEEMWHALVITVPEYLTHLPAMSLGTGQFADTEWVGQWTINYWSWWIAWAPFVGIFIAIVSKGRTLREMIFSIMVAPTVFSLVWFTMFGGAAIYLQRANHFAGEVLDLSDVHIILFKMLNTYTHNDVLSILAMLLCAIFLINSADSASYTLATLSQRIFHKKESIEDKLESLPDADTSDDSEPSFFLQMGWGLLIAFLTYSLLVSGGLGILQKISTIAVLPFMLILSVVFVFVIWMLIRYYRAHYVNSDS